MKIKHLKKPTKQELINDLNFLCGHKLSLDYNFEVLDKVVETSGSPMFEAVYMSFDFACDMLSKRHDISPDDVGWFVYDNEMGEASLECAVVIDGVTKFKEIKTVEDFVDTIRTT